MRTAITRALMILFPVLVLSNSVGFGEDPRPFAHSPLTDADVESAVKTGLRLDRNKVGLRFTVPTRSAQPFLAGAADDRLGHFMQSSGTRYETTGFLIEVFTPYSWIQREASIRAAKGGGMTPSDVTEQMKEPVLRILCHPDTPVSATEGVLGVEVERVSIRSTAKKDFQALEPAHTERLATPVRVALVEVADFGSLLAYFPVEEVLRIGRLDRKGEFYIDIVPAKGEPGTLKVKTKHFSQLP